MPHVPAGLAALLLLAGCAAGGAGAGPPAGTDAFRERLSLAPCTIPAMSETGQKIADEPARCGTFLVPENRRLAGGRVLPLKVVVLPARAARPREPVFLLSGGPGQAASESAPGYAGSSYRDLHDLVLMDVRGTGEGHALDCAVGASDDNLQAYLEPLFHEGSAFAGCRDALSAKADLTQYTTTIAMTDLDELRRALGYGRINLEGGSYGTRAALTYIRMFPRRVHAAILFSQTPPENRAPLFHAAAAQRGFDRLVAQCQAEAPCRAAFPDPHGDLKAIQERLRQAPAPVTVRHPVSGAPTPILLTASGFADGLRVMLYSAERGRQVPLLLSRGRAGDLAPFAEAALANSRGVRNSLRMGLLLAFTCSEDVWRIRPEEVARETAGSFIGDARVRGQMAACAGWPRGDVPDAYYRLARARVPTLIVSGDLDPVTPPSWGEAMRRHLPNSMHVVMPGGHTPWSPCIEGLARRLLDTGSVKGLDTGCVANERNPPFVLPGAAPG